MVWVFLLMELIYYKTYDLEYVKNMSILLCSCFIYSQYQPMKFTQLILVSFL